MALTKPKRQDQHTQTHYRFGVRSLAVLLSLMLTYASASAKADPEKVLRTLFPAAETGFDPAISRDLYSAQVTQAVFETLYTYDYLARPAKIVPMTAEGMPEVSADGKTYTIHLRKGILFHQDPAFNGKPRELTVADYVYSYMRLMDPRLHSGHTWLLEGKIQGLDECVEAARKSGHYDVDHKIPGFEVLDKYTLRIHLTQPSYIFPMLLAHEPAVALAREVVEKYQDAQGQVMDHPVGTGPYYLKEWVRASRIVLEASPEYRGLTWDFAPSSDPEDQKIIERLKGKTMPQIGRIEISVMLEDQTRILAFAKDQVDLFELQGPLAPKFLREGKLKPEYASKGVQLSRIVDPEITYYYWNFGDPVLGGLGKEKIALRRAISMAYNVDEEIEKVWNGEAVRLQFPIPPGVVGYDPAYKSLSPYDPGLANTLLDKYGYKQGSDGWRTLPDGSPLELHYTARNDSTGQSQAETWKKAMDKIHVKLDANRIPFGDILKAEKECQLQFRTAPWVADYPDGDNFMQLFYGPNVGANNNGCSKIPEYDELFAKSMSLPPGVERDQLYHKMARILDVNAVVMMGYARYRNMVSHPRVIGHKKHPILHQEWLYIDIDKAQPQGAKP